MKLSRSSFAEKTRITKRPTINEKQHERESVWPIGYFLDFVTMIIVYYFGLFHNLPVLRTDGFIGRDILMHILVHATIVEFLYYWAHVALHWQPIYKRYHQYHHKSINTEPRTALSFEVGERLLYTALFAIAPIVVDTLGYQSYFAFFSYLVLFDLMNEGGHINFEVVGPWWFNSPLRFIVYTPSFHAIHHTKFKKNFSLFMPWPDMLFGSDVWLNPYSTATPSPSPAAAETQQDTQEEV
jgi:aldehyde decarbonylase